MGKIFYIIGKSSSGKDTIFKKLLEDQDLNLKTIVSYTTRPIRDGEENGVEYYFVDENVVKRAEKDGTLIELRSYHTCHGNWMYFTLADHQIDFTSSDYIMIGTLESYLSLRDYFGKDKVIPILIELDDGIRLQRALDREKCQENPKYQELCRRFLADASDFSTEKIDHAGITRSFYNDDLNRCMREIKEYISRDLE
ncbi:MAG: guanylate kinase [Lachnospiraceae bacterium]|nr:guanylate kinase [Lachnospiraceae bacterium]MDD3659495.1 guanylate kinase [Lachnospiraceae bacterium]